MAQRVLKILIGRKCHNLRKRHDMTKQILAELQKLTAKDYKKAERQASKYYKKYDSFTQGISNQWLLAYQDAKETIAASRVKK